MFEQAGDSNGRYSSSSLGNHASVSANLRCLRSLPLYKIILNLTDRAVLVNFIRGPGADLDLSFITTSCSFSQSSFPRLKAKAQCTDFFSYIFDGTYSHHSLGDFSKWNIGFDLLDLTLNFAFKSKQVGVFQVLCLFIYFFYWIKWTTWSKKPTGTLAANCLWRLFNVC